MNKEIMMKELKLNIGNLNIIAMISEMDGETFIALRPFIEHLGLDWGTQSRKVANNPQFNCCHMPTVGADGKNRVMLCVPVKQIGMWLATINASRTRAEVRDKLIQFQMHLQIVIHEALTGKVTAERVSYLEQKLAEVLGYLTQVLRKNEELQCRVEYLEAGTNRFEQVEASYAGSRLVNQRWANKERNGLKLVQ